MSALSANAQSCEGQNSYDDINLNCIKENDELFEALVKKEVERDKALKNAIKEEKEKDRKRAELAKNLIFFFSDETVKKNTGRVFLYQTAAGNYGKMLISSITNANNQCSLSFDLMTYINGKAGKRVTRSASIMPLGGSWKQDIINIEGANTKSDFVLKREYGLCALKRRDGYLVPYKKFIKEEENQNIILVYAALFFIGLAVFLITRTIFQDDEKYRAQEKLEDAEIDEKRNVPNDIVLKYSRPFFRRYFTPIVNGMKSRRKIREKYKRRLASSGMNKFLTPEDFYAFKLFLIIGFPIVYLFMRSFLELEADLPLAGTPVLSLFGYFYPDIWISGKIAQRRQEITQNMPFIVDMLALSVEAGLDFVAAMQRVIEKAPHSALVDEFETMIKETKIGLSRAEGLRQLSWRVDTLAISSFCATLISADAVGADIAPILKTLAQEVREKRSSLAEQKGAQAATKILIPMIFLVLPSVLLIIAAPMAMKLMGGN